MIHQQLKYKIHTAIKYNFHQPKHMISNHHKLNLKFTIQLNR